jgi:hypothetical protein
MKTKEELQEMAQLVRIHEANCGLLFPSRDETGFRLAIMKKLAQQLGLKELRGASFETAALQPAAPTSNATTATPEREPRSTKRDGTR